MKYSYNMSYGDIDKGIVSVGKRAKTLRDNVHHICVSILARWIETGDASTAASKASALVEHADKYQAQAVVNWFSVYAGFQWDTTEKCFGYTETTITMEQAKAAKDEPFWQLTPPKEPTPFDLPGKIMHLIEQANKRREKGLKDGDDIPQDMLDKLKEVLSA